MGYDYCPEDGAIPRSDDFMSPENALNACPNLDSKCGDSRYILLENEDTDPVTFGIASDFDKDDQCSWLVIAFCDLPVIEIIT